MGTNIPRERKKQKMKKRGQNSGHRNNIIVDDSQGIMDKMRD